MFLYVCPLVAAGFAFALPVAEDNDPVRRKAAYFQNLEIRSLKKNLGFPAGGISAVCQDSSGCLWIGTQLGLYCYDGFSTRLLKNDMERPQRLTSNKITCLAENGHVLWVGTGSGLNRMDRKDGSCTQYHLNEFSNSDEISTLLVTRNGMLWVGTEGGLYKYDRKNDRFVLMCDQRGNSSVPHCAIKSLYEDSRNYVWIGTWDKGLFRYDPKKNVFYMVPKFNDMNSAQAVYEDKSHRLWIGTWGKGVYLIENPHETSAPLRFRNFMRENTDGNLVSDMIYSIVDDPYTGLLWFGTAKGLAFCSYESGQENFFRLPAEKESVPGMFARGSTPLLCDRDGNIWISTQPAGVAVASTFPKVFQSYALDEAELKEDLINTLTYDHEGNLWFGQERTGIVCRMGATGDIVRMNHIPGIPDMHVMQKINVMQETKDGSMLAGTTQTGFIVIAADRKSARHYNCNNTPWLPDNCVYSFCEDREGNLLVGTWKGMCVRYTNGKGLYLSGKGLAELGNAQIRHIIQSTDGCFWLATKNKGIICLSGDIHSPGSLSLKQYLNPLDTELRMMEICKILQDARGRIWACSQGVGLMLYNEKKGGFECVNRKYGIPDDDICSIEEGMDGNLWISSRTHIMCLSLDAKGNLIRLRYFSGKDMPGFYFGKGVSGSFHRGTVVFGGLNNYVIFSDQQQSEEESVMKIGITDIKIFNVPLEMLPKDVRNGVSFILPPYTEHICLTPAQNDLTIEFSHFNYSIPEESRFAYMLEGHDKEWIYPEAGVSSAYYSNLSPGTYRFRLKAADANGIWQEMSKPMSIEVLPPWWLRWWAVLLYALLLAAVGLYLVRYLRLREAQRRELHLAHLSKEKIEELNHKKLQFFTNITHDLMTPLTVISATISELEIECPQMGNAYKIIRSNLNKQMRLFQQILEFRKAETGNLQLRVSKESMADFLRKEVESIQPLMNRKKLHFSLLCQPEQITGYFDPDALDKILYNLLSNAAKYTQEMGYVQVTLTLCEGDNEGFVRIMVKDNGKGIPESRMADLFKRFYEGEHRRFNTYGTGIGLSLTKDLVELHHGTISVESREGEGTTFTLMLPIEVRFYQEEEVDDSWSLPVAEVSDGKSNGRNPDLLQDDEYDDMRAEGDEDDPNAEDTGEEKPYTLLIVEDNEELIILMKNLLRRNYHVLTAYNGKEGLDVMKSRKVDLVVADVMMPVMNGVEMVKQVKSDMELNHIPVIMLTAKRGEDERAEAYEAGADAYITKPFHLSVLLARIENLLKRREKVLKEIRDKLFDGFGDLDITNADEEFLRKCVGVVQKHLNDADFDQQEFADGVSTSKSTLYKKLKALTGLNTSAFIRNIRMKAAKDIILKNPNIRISDLAYAVGYNDPKYFSTCFKKDFGVLPSEYGKEQSPLEEPPAEG